jgi:UDP-GlcNAc:undecaprenyl-phosphate GlcNAc-1-phosphate transferase
LGIRNHQDFIIRWNHEAKPSLGGIGFFIGFLFTVILYSIAFGESSVFRNVQFLGLFCAASLAFFMGLADDAYNTRPVMKLLVQILCGLIIALTGTTIQFFDNHFINVLITVVWVVGVMNSINMLDNMDGISSVVSSSIFISCVTTMLIMGGKLTSIEVVLLVSTIGTLLGFLVYNWHPSKLFMGDAGSQFIGFLLAYFSIHPLWNISTRLEQHSWLGMMICLVAFTPAAVDTLTVFINRIAKGKSPMVGGKDHTTHHLVYRGFSEKKVLLIFLLISVLSTIIAILMLYCLILKLNLLVCLFCVYFFVIFGLLYRNTKKYKSL